MPPTYKFNFSLPIAGGEALSSENIIQTNNGTDVQLECGDRDLPFIESATFTWYFKKINSLCDYSLSNCDSSISGSSSLDDKNWHLLTCDSDRPCALSTLQIRRFGEDNVGFYKCVIRPHSVDNVSTELQFVMTYLLVGKCHMVL